MAPGYLKLRQELADLLYQQQQLLLVTGPNLEARWHQLLGGYQVELEQVSLEHRRLRRQLDLYRAAHHRGEAPDPESVEKRLDQELWEWRRRIRDLKDKQEAASQRLRKLRSAETSAALRSLYRQLVKRLHPDLHPEQTPQQQQLWFDVQQAYQWGDFERLETLLAITDDQPLERPEEVPRLQARLNQLSEDLQKLQESFPFHLQKQLADPHWQEEQIHRFKLEIVLQRHQCDKVKAVLEEFC